MKTKTAKPKPRVDLIALENRKQKAVALVMCADSREGERLLRKLVNKLAKGGFGS